MRRQKPQLLAPKLPTALRQQLVNLGLRHHIFHFPDELDLSDTVIHFGLFPYQDHPDFGRWLNRILQHASVEKILLYNVPAEPQKIESLLESGVSDVLTDQCKWEDLTPGIMYKYIQKLPLRIKERASLVPRTTFSNWTVKSGEPLPTAKYVQLRVLRSFGLYRQGGRSINLPKRKQIQQLLVYFLLQPASHISRQRLQRHLWPHFVDKRAANNAINVAIHGLRAWLREHELLPIELNTNADGYCLLIDGPFVTDYAICQEAINQGLTAAAYGKWAEVSDCFHRARTIFSPQAFDPWAEHPWFEDTKTQLQDQLYQLGRIFVDQLMQTSSYAAAIPRLLELLELDPCNETEHADLMRSHYWTGNKVKALQQFTKCAKALRLHHHFEPSQKLQRLYNQILHEKLQPCSDSESNTKSSPNGA